MNRILFNKQECLNEDGLPVVVFPFSDPRGKHLKSILKSEAGDFVRLGEIDGPRFDAAQILSTEGEAYRITLGTPTPTLPRAPVDLLLALPRPKAMQRLWFQIAQYGVGKIYITAANKVELGYWGSTYLKPEEYISILTEGLEQSGDTVLPKVEIHRRLKPLIQEILPARYPENARFLAHPPHEHAPCSFPPLQHSPSLIAVGPEGGWTPYELDLFKALNFQFVSLGERIFRTDTAVCSLLALATQSR